MTIQNSASLATSASSLNNEKLFSVVKDTPTLKTRWFKGSVRTSAETGQYFSETLKRASYYYSDEEDFVSPECGLHQWHVLRSQYLPSTENSYGSHFSLFLHQYRVRPTTIAFSVALMGDDACIDVRVGPGRLVGWTRDEQIQQADIVLGQQVHPLALEPFTLLCMAIKMVEQDFEWNASLIDHFKKFKLEPVMAKLHSIRK